MNIEELFPSCDGTWFKSPSYSDIVSKFGTVLLESSDADYSGDTFCLIEKDGKYGYLEFGLGSCSGCDALQACNNYADLQSLFDALESGIKWFSSKSDLKDWIAARDWESQWSWHDGAKSFVPRAIEVLS